MVARRCKYLNQQTVSFKPDGHIFLKKSYLSKKTPTRMFEKKNQKWAHGIWRKYKCRKEFCEYIYELFGQNERGVRVFQLKWKLYSYASWVQCSWRAYMHVKRKHGAATESSAVEMGRQSRARMGSGFGPNNGPSFVDRWMFLWWKNKNQF